MCVYVFVCTCVWNKHARISYMYIRGRVNVKRMVERCCYIAIMICARRRRRQRRRAIIIIFCTRSTHWKFAGKNNNNKILFTETKTIKFIEKIVSWHSCWKIFIANLLCENSFLKCAACVCVCMAAGYLCVCVFIEMYIIGLWTRTLALKRTYVHCEIPHLKSIINSDVWVRYIHAHVTLEEEESIIYEKRLVNIISKLKINLYDDHYNVRG